MEEVEAEQRENRAARLARRNQVRDPNTQDDADDGGRLTGRSLRNAPRRPNYTEESPGVSLENSPDQDMPTRRGRGRPSNAELQRRREFEEL